MVELKVLSSAFNDGDMIPRLYTCDDRNISPPLSWSGIPGDAKSISLICDDPDAPVGNWVHWVVFNIPHDIDELQEHVSAVGLPAGAKQGINDFRKLDYGGPCPPGGTHRYFFKLYALDTVLSLQEGASRAELLEAMEGHILAQGQLMGRYKRQ